MRSTTSRLTTKAAVAVTLVGGGVALTAGHASAAPAPAPTTSDQITQWGQNLLTQAGPQIQGLLKVIQPQDDPNVAETVADPNGATSTGLQGDDFIFGQSQAGPNGSKVTILKAFGEDILTKEGDADGGHYGGLFAPIGEGIDWVNSQTCPSGAHGGEDLCITFLDSHATTKTTTDKKPVSQTIPIKTLADSVLPKDGIFKTPAVRNAVLGLLGNGTVTATGESDGTSTQNDADFSLFKISQGTDSLAVLPTDAHYGSFKLGPGQVHTTEVVIPKQTVLGFFKIPEIKIPAQTFTTDGLPRTCYASGSAATIRVTGDLAPVADFFGQPKSASSTGSGDACQTPGPVLTSA